MTEPNEDEAVQPASPDREVAAPLSPAPVVPPSYVKAEKTFLHYWWVPVGLLAGFILSKIDVGWSGDDWYIPPHDTSIYELLIGLVLVGLLEPSFNVGDRLVRQLRGK